MIEKFKENFGEGINKGIEKAEKFDREAEKKYRQKVRKILSEKLSEALKDSDLKKTGYSSWSRKIKDSWRLVYLQRSQFSHEYYIEAGICKENDIPKGEKLEIRFCKERERIEYIVRDIEEKRLKEEGQTKERLLQDKVNTVKAALEFEAPGARKKYPGEYFVPSVNPEEAKHKIEEIQKVVGEYVPLWFKKQ